MVRFEIGRDAPSIGIYDSVDFCSFFSESEK